MMEGRDADETIGVIEMVITGGSGVEAAHKG